jgi:hypothetical protein
MEVIAQLGSILGLSFISGINLYATVAVTGICVRTGLITGLPVEFQVLGNDAVIFVALVLYLVEFFMDKIQGLDVLWDGIHTFIRPLGGAFIALMQVGEATAAVEVIVFMLGASLASAAHATKAGTRLVVNASPEPVSNVVISTVEDVVVVGYTYMSLAYPKVTFFVTLACVAAIIYLLPLLIRTLKMLFGALFFAIRSLLVLGETPAPTLLPLHMDTFFEDRKGENEGVLWAGRAYASKVPAVRRSAPVYLVVTSGAVYLLYRRWFRSHIKRLSRSEIELYKYYSGRLLAKCMIRASGETWLLQVYQSLGKTLPRDLNPAAEAG